MDIQYQGNKDFLQLPSTAFLASGTIKPDEVLKCFDWAVNAAKEGRCIVSGFSSYMEREVLLFLAKGKQPIILVLARQMYKKIPSELQSLLDDNRLLIISVSNSPRQTKATAFERNKYICEMAEQILFVGVTEKSSLYPLYNNYSQKCCTL